MEKYLEALKLILAETQAQALEFPQENTISESLTNLIQSLKAAISEIEGSQQGKNLIFGEFSMKNRIDVIEDMPLVFQFDKIGTLSTVANKAKFEQDLKPFLNKAGTFKLDYFYYSINAATNDITFYFAWWSDSELTTEISAIFGTKKYTFGAIHTNKFYARYDDSPSKDFLAENNTGFALSYNVIAPGSYIDKIKQIKSYSGILADLRFLRPDHPELPYLVSKFKNQNWRSIITQNGKHTLNKDGLYIEIKYK